MADPVSWLVIEPGWEVVSVDGERVGRVEEIAGDSSTDIFDGLSISTSLAGAPRYVPAEQVQRITHGQVVLKVSKTEAGALGEYLEPPTSAEIEPEKAGLLTRAEAKVEAPIRRRPEHEHIVRRIWLRLWDRIRSS